MPKTYKKSHIVLYSLHIPLIILGVSLLVLPLIIDRQVTTTVNGERPQVQGKSDSKGGSSKSSKSNKSDNKSNKKSDSNTNQPQSVNAQLHKKNVEAVVVKLEEVAENEEVAGNEETGENIGAIADEIENEVEDTTDLISEIESRPKWQTLLIGTSYKNLGQLRSALAHNTNSIRKLTNQMGDTQLLGSGSELQNQFQLLMQERDRIQQVLSSNESQFSILGWAFRFLSGYDTSNPIGGPDVNESTETSESTTTPIQ